MGEIIFAIVTLFLYDFISTPISDAVEDALLSIGKTAVVETVEFSDNDIAISAGDKIEGSLIFTGPDGTYDDSEVDDICSQYKMVWLSSDSNVLRVSQDGEIRALQDGFAVIEVKSYNTDDLYAKMLVTVHDPDEPLTSDEERIHQQLYNVYIADENGEPNSNLLYSLDAILTKNLRD